MTLYAQCYKAFIKAGVDPDDAANVADIIYAVNERTNANALLTMSEDLAQAKLDIGALTTDVAKIKADLWWIKAAGGGFLSVIVGMLGVIISKI